MSNSFRSQRAFEAIPNHLIGLLTAIYEFKGMKESRSLLPWWEYFLGITFAAYEQLDQNSAAGSCRQRQIASS
jgi:hypothetical protein